MGRQLTPPELLASEGILLQEIGNNTSAALGGVFPDPRFHIADFIRQQIAQFVQENNQLFGVVLRRYVIGELDNPLVGHVNLFT